MRWCRVFVSLLLVAYTVAIENSFQEQWLDGRTTWLITPPDTWPTETTINSADTSIPAETTLGETTLAETTFADTTPAETPPAETPPTGTPPAETPPAETPPAETPPAETPPAETPPAETTPDTTIAYTTPAETTIADTTPAETTPVETTPAETTPAETTPAETTPAQTTPAETTPTETTFADTTPTEITTPITEAPPQGLPLAEPCDEEACQLPYCRCSSTSIPGGLAPRNTPQFVLLTFSLAVNPTNMPTYRNLYGRQNSNGCLAGVSFFINHEYTNYQLVNELYNNGFEIGLHSITHQTPSSYWSQATYEDIVREFAHQRVQMSHFANIPHEALQGVRMPLLQMTGNSSFQVIADYNLTYDLTWPTQNNINPGLWPYTLDYASTQDCPIPPCPTASIPGAWVLPTIPWLDLNGTPCFMVDSCFWIPDHEDEEGWFQLIVTNFERQYFGNRAPFGFHIQEWYLSAHPAIMRAWLRWLAVINNLNDVFMVNANDVIDWVKDPIPINEYRERPCKWFIETNCPAFECGPLRAEHNNQDYYLQICNVCPRTYPWLGNPLGQ